MDMSDAHGSSVTAPEPPVAAGDAQSGQEWLALVGEFGADVAGPLTAALDRIDSLTKSGRIVRADLKALREEVAQARQVGMLGQQLSILAAGGARLAPERLVLDDTVQSLLGQRAGGVTDREVSVAVSAPQAEVMVDPTLMFCLLNTLFEWALGNAAGRCEFKTAAGPAPENLQLVCRFEPRISDTLTIDLAEAARPPRLNALAWRILEQTARTMGVHVQVEDSVNSVVLTLQFVRAAAQAAPAAALGSVATRPARPLAGSQVLVISSRREMRVQIRDALRSMGLMIDFVSSVSEAQEFCHDGPPDAVIVESIQCGERFAKFRDEVRAAAPDSAFVEIVEQGRTFEKSGPDGARAGRVGRDVIDTSLPAALLHELSKAR
jgi:CheY-like chemotaxis protein